MDAHICSKDIVVVFCALDFNICYYSQCALSMRIVFSSRTILARGWRVVNVPDDESNSVNFVDLYTKIIKHTLDPLEPFVLPKDKTSCSYSS